MGNKNYTEHLNELGFYEALPKPTAEELSEYYKNKYFQTEQSTYSNSYSAEELEHIRNVAKIALTTVTRFNIDRSLLDLGCGEGFFTECFHSYGWNVTCCDFSEWAITTHNKKMLGFFTGGDIFDSIEHYIKKQKTFGLVNLQNVLEHVLDPVLLLEKLKPLFHKNSGIRIRVPNDYSSFQLDLLKNNHTQNTWFKPPEHLSYFNKEGLLSLLKHCGYELLTLQTDFPIEMFLANPNANYWKDRSLGKGAHLARIFCENHLVQENLADYIGLMEASGKLGFGRELIAYARPVVS